MIIKEFVSKDTSNRTRMFLELQCEVCKTIFSRQKRLVNTHTCSAKCRNAFTGITVELQCDNCGVPFFRAKSKLDNSKSGKYFCCRQCKDTAQTYMEEIRPEHYGNGRASYREKAFRHYKPICTKCGFPNRLALEVHHKDKDRNNNEIDNLEILCANCHNISHALLA